MDFIRFMLFNYDGTIDWFGVVVIVMLVFVAVALVIIIIEALQSGAAVSRFFNKYETNTGTVDSYEYSEEHTSTVLIPSTIGKVVVNTPRTIHHEAGYFINLMCNNQGVEFIATYEIPKSEFRVYKVGDTVKVEDYWKRYGYKVLED